jgi:hypothetical protein
LCQRAKHRFDNIQYTIDSKPEIKFFGPSG